MWLIGTDDYEKIRNLFNEEYKKTKKLISKGETHLDNLAEGFTEADRVLWKYLHFDAVKVVRCKDCNNSADVACGVMYCCYFNKNVEEDGYCYEGC